jgi:hypothetical protein
MLGVEPPEEEPPFEEEEFGASPYQAFLERFAGGLQRTRLPQPRSFGEGLLSGFAGGLGGAGARVAERREKFEAGQAERRKAIDARRIKASDEYRKERGEALRTLGKEQRAERTKAAEYERDNPLVTPELKVKYPAIARIPEGERLDPETWRKVKQSMLPQGMDRQADAAERAARAAERADRTARIQTSGSLAKDYRDDPDVKEFPPIRDSYGTAKSGAAKGTSAGDIILMRMVAKMTDPTTGVREEEFRTFEGAQGELVRRGVGLTTGMVGAGQLTPLGRQRLLDEVEGIYQRKLGHYRDAREHYRQRATDFDEDPDRLIRDYERGVAAGRVPGSGPGAVPPDPDKGKIYVDRNGNVVGRD